MAKRSGQDDLTRRRRLNEGRCLTHGCKLCQVMSVGSGALRVGCPRLDCNFQTDVIDGSKLDKARNSPNWSKA